VGNLTFWDSIFATRSPSVIVNTNDHGSNQMKWTEGPVVWRGKIDGAYDARRLLFSDTIDAKIYSYDLIHNNDGNALKVLLEFSGDAPVEDYFWRGEPGSNGLAILPTSSSPPDDEKGDNAKNNLDSNEFIVMCQHGAQRLALLNIKTGARIPLVSAWNGRKLNGPNDLVVKVEGGKAIVYFTDPVYAWLEKDSMEDLPYLDKRVKQDGPGFCGVYRIEFPMIVLELSNGVENEDLKKELAEGSRVSLVTKMDRPNGIGLDGNNLVVAECCQGTHNLKCKQGTSRWVIFQRKNCNNDSCINGAEWRRVSTIEDVIEESNDGCADGFEVLDHPHGNGRVLIASCSGGLCIVDLQEGKVVARLLTAKEDGCKISNIANGEDRLFISGNCGVWELELQKNQPPSSSRLAEL